MKVTTFDSEAGAKRSIRKIVAFYKDAYPDEYKQLVKAVDMHRKLLSDPKFAKADAGGDSDQRALYEISEKLNTALVMGLSSEELTWLKSGTKASPNQGGRWFATSFREFSLPSQV